MKKKIVCIFILTLLIATALPTIGAGDEVKNILDYSSKNNPYNLKIKEETNAEQAFFIEWNKTFGGPEFDMLYCVRETNDGGFIACGETDPSWIPHAWLLKLDSDGNAEWNATLPSTGEDYWHWPFFVIQTKDGGYITCGLIGDSDAVADGFLLKVDSQGTIEWNKTYPWGEGEFGPIRCIQEVDDGYIAVGNTQGSTSGDYDGFVFTTDLLGNVESKKIFSLGEYQELLFSIRATSDGGYIIGGSGSPVNYHDYWLIKTDLNLNIEWDQTFGGPLTDFSLSRNCLPTEDGGYIMNGFSYSFGGGGEFSDIWLVKTDSAGNMEWNKTFGDSGEHDGSWSVDTSHDGGYIFTGAKNWKGETAPKGELWIVKTDSDGNIVRSQTFGGSGEDRGMYIEKTSDGGYIVSGTTQSFGNLYGDGWIMKLASFDNQKPDKPDKPSGETKIEVGTEYHYTSNTTDSDGDQVYYLWDWGDGNYSEWLGPYNSGDTCYASYIWADNNTYDIRVMAKDEFEAEGDWSDPLTVSTPRSRTIYNSLLLRLFERLPNLLPLLRYILGFY